MYFCIACAPFRSCPTLTRAAENKQGQGTCVTILASRSNSLEVALFQMDTAASVRLSLERACLSCVPSLPPQAMLSASCEPGAAACTGRSFPSDRFHYQYAMQRL